MITKEIIQEKRWGRRERKEEIGEEELKDVREEEREGEVGKRERKEEVGESDIQRDNT